MYMYVQSKKLQLEPQLQRGYKSFKNPVQIFWMWFRKKLRVGGCLLEDSDLNGRLTSRGSDFKTNPLLFGMGSGLCRILLLFDHQFSNCKRPIYRLRYRWSLQRKLVIFCVTYIDIQRRKQTNKTWNKSSSRHVWPINMHNFTRWNTNTRKIDSLKNSQKVTGQWVVRTNRCNCRYQ